MGGNSPIGVNGSSVEKTTSVNTGQNTAKVSENLAEKLIFDPSANNKNSSEGSMVGLTVEKTSTTTAATAKKATTAAKTTASNKLKRIDKNDPEILKNAPKPDFTLAGEQKKATLVVNLSENRLYRYTPEGEPYEVYQIASGTKQTPTHTGLRKVVAIETYPYDKAPEASKRRQNPKDYGPNILILDQIDPNTGKDLGSNGEFIHGNKNPASIGKYASHGCMRMDNDVIKQFAKEIKRGSYVIIQ